MVLPEFPPVNINAFQEFDMDKFRQEQEEAKKQKIADLQACSKSLHELVVYVGFSVKSVVCESSETGFTPDSEARCGGIDNVYQGGYTSKLVLLVQPDNKDIPVGKLTFNGFSAVRAGDHIDAQILLHKEERVDTTERPLVECEMGDLVFYLSRDFMPEESAIEIAIFSTKEKGYVRIDRSVEYDRFVQK